MITYTNDEIKIKIEYMIIGKPKVVNHKGKIVECNAISWNIKIRNNRT